jgi:multisubunit Na+/H+ antiporter MnhB subunit
MDAEYSASMKLKIYIWAGTGILCGAANLLDTVFKYFSTSSLISTDTDLLTVTSGLIPWFNLVVFGTAALFICYSLYLFGKLKEDVELKYL